MGPNRAALPGLVQAARAICWRLPETKARPSGASGLRLADLGFGAAGAQGDVFGLGLGLGLGEHVGQGAQAQAWSLRDGQAEKSASPGP